MSGINTVTSRYSDADLKEFKDLIENKLEKAKNQYQSLKEQLKDITENNNDDFAKDITDFSSIQSEVEMLTKKANHQRKNNQDLENTLTRINNTKVIKKTPAAKPVVDDLDDENEIDKLFSELDVIKELDEADLIVDDDDDSDDNFDSDDDLDMIADESSEYDDDDDDY